MQTIKWSYVTPSNADLETTLIESATLDRLQREKKDETFEGNGPSGRV